MGYCLCQKVEEDQGPGRHQVQLQSSHLEQVEALRIDQGLGSCWGPFGLEKLALEIVEVVEEDLDPIPNQLLDMDPK